MANEKIENELLPEQEEQDINELRQIRLEKLEKLQQAGKDPFEVTVAQQSITAQEIIDRFEELENTDVSICGRILTWRDMGKANFINISDRSGRMQVYVRINDIGEEEFAEFKKWDIGDIIEVKGYVFKTRTGQITVHAKSVKLLSKSLLPLPEKFHGLKDVDTRYRQRYLDLITNPESMETFKKRSQIIKEIRSFLDKEDFIEVETPILVQNAGGAAARPFLTHHNSLNEDLKLRISLELYLKRLIVGGMERVFEIGRVFRNEGLDIRHNPEFTLMELYQAYTDYNGMMDLTERLFKHLAEKVIGSPKFTYGENEIDFSKPFERITMTEAVKKYTGIDFDAITFEEA
ncbi:MAG: lysine--tRNA ligase, partial [Clostridia bacterium]|nr:lysine--tRNA ligase [Clostridia bacterium]